MKKITTYLVVCLFGIGFSANAQYHLNAFNPAGENPGGLNTDPEQPFGAAGVTAGDGYSSLIANGTTTLSWSANQTIPFSFNFDGSPVTQYKVSNSGVLTFSTGATTVPSNNNDTLGTTDIPDNSVCIWGLEQFTGNDGVISKTFGTAPNRQHWVIFASFSAPGATGSQWTYWGIALEESTDNIYIVDMRTFNTPLSLTLGIQIDTLTKIQVSGAPLTPSNVTNGGNASDATDNVYYEFVQGNRPTNDVSLSAIDKVNIVAEGDDVTISGEFLNKGANPLDSVYVVWSDDGGTTTNRELQTGFSISTLQSQSFTHGTTLTASNPGSFSNVDVWLELPTSKTDGNLLNDSSSFEFFVNKGQTVSKNALFEEFTTAPCQFCPDGAVVADYINDNVSNAIVVGVHACFGTDGMTVTEASELCSTIGSGSAPSGMVDRVLFDGEAEPAFGRGPLTSVAYTPATSGWTVRTEARIALGAPVTVDVDGEYTASSRTIDVDVTANFVDFPQPGDLNVSLMIVEDSVTGTGSGFNQVNFYDTQTGHPYAGAGNPIIGFVHKHVLRDILPSTFGDNTVIPSTIALNTDYSRNFTVTLPNSYDADQISIVAVVSYAGPGLDGYEVLNAKELKLDQLALNFTDADLTSLNVQDSLADGDTVDIAGMITNIGNDTIDSYGISWSVNGGTVFTEVYSNLSIDSAGTSSFTHKDKFIPADAKIANTLSVWISSINGNPNMNTMNDTISKTFLFNTGIVKNSLNVAGLSIYPNPSKNIANVAIELEKANTIQLDVMDITGKVIATDNLGVMAKGSQLIRLNVADFANGFYFINLRVGDEMITRKFTVAK